MSTRRNVRLPVVFVTNKADLELERKVSKRQIEELSARYCYPLYETSEKLDVDMKQPFQDVLCQIASKEDDIKLTELTISST